MNELQLRLLTTLRYVRRQGLPMEEVERCVGRVKEEESARTVDARMREHRAGVESIRSRLDAEGSE